MESLLLVVFILSIVIHIVNTLGAATINDLLWLLYNKLPTPTSHAARDQARLRREVLRLKKEMNSVSAQDDFARWAKLRRAHDKVYADYQKTESSLKSSRTLFDRTVSTLRFLGTNGLRFALQFWYAKQALFWIPQGWVPRYVEWILAFPKAPTGSVSIQIWGIACASVVGMVGEALAALWVLSVRSSKMQHRNKEGLKEKPVAAADDGGEKKEL
ncbi:CHD5-like protein-domain-containing protein [Phyllosticta citriasiana]|uniref:CHD5-like protein-domain-containing protein n=1 Tax=Phyllosticta citriasiana TaxID=595635 RepID=A0ABR1KXA9_9PEZI